MVIFSETLKCLLYFVGMLSIATLTMTMYDYINYCKKIKERDL